MTTEPDDREWKWWWATEDRERSNGPYDSAEEAVSAAAESGHTYQNSVIFVFEGAHQKLRDDIFEAWRIAEIWCERNEEILDPGEYNNLDVSHEQEKQLEQMLNATFALWRKMHDLGRAWALDTRNERKYKIVKSAVPEDNTDAR